MKNIFKLGFILLFISLKSNAQDTSLYQGPCDIYLRPGQIIKHVLLWEIDSMRVTYNANENLSEVLTGDVLRIVTNYYELSFDEQSHVIKKDYDLIVQRPGDTVKGFITRVKNGRYLEYTSVTGKRNKETVYMSFIVSQTDKSDIAVCEQTGDEGVKPIEVKTKTYPSAKNNKKNKDLIITNTGDTLLCHILKDKDTRIEYSILRFGHDTRTFIDKKDVLYYHDAKEAKAGWKVPVTIVVVCAAIFATLLFVVTVASY